MLAKAQRDMLDARKSNFNEAKKDLYKDQKYVDFTLRQYVKRQLDSLADVLEVIDALPPDQISKIIEPAQQTNLLKLIEKVFTLRYPVVVKYDKDNQEFRSVRNYKIGFGDKHVKAASGQARAQLLRVGQRARIEPRFVHYLAPLTQASK